MPIADAGFEGDGTTSGSNLLLVRGPTILVTVGLHPEHSPDGTVIPGKSVLALIDTGATLTCIDEALAQELKLPVIDKQTCSGIDGTCELDVYAAQVTAPSLGGISQYGRFGGVKLTQGGQMHQILIGRTFLQHVIMIYDGRTGSVRLSH
jgi:predicted aspartyl protease